MLMVFHLPHSHEIVSMEQITQCQLFMKMEASQTISHNYFRIWDFYKIHSSEINIYFEELNVLMKKIISTD